MPLIFYAAFENLQHDIDASEAFVAFVRDLLTHDPSLRPEAELVASDVWLLYVHSNLPTVIPEQGCDR